jgi:hypothetical protein
MKKGEVKKTARPSLRPTVWIGSAVLPLHGTAGYLDPAQKYLATRDSAHAEPGGKAEQRAARKSA